MSIYEPRCPIDRETDKARGLGFVDMFESAEEDAAILALDSAEWLGRSLRVDKVKPKTNNREVRSGGRGRYQLRLACGELEVGFRATSFSEHW